MLRKKLFFVLLLIITAQTVAVVAQEAGPHDFGKMWTFENPPKDWFAEQYDFEPGDEWFDDVRKASLKFASWCSGSFVSPNGLIMTNHHCSRGVSLRIEKEGEDFTNNGFYAKNQEDERKVEGLFVDQLIYAIDISDEISEIMTNSNGSISEKAAIDKVKQKYSTKPMWKDLRVELVQYYSGAKHSLYAYKRYDDIRLVLVPEVKIGFYGGEEDNFTFPRYNLDFTFWRAYDKSGQPVNSSANYFPFNPNGPSENDPVFVIGNPARTERYKTVAQLDFDRDYRFPMLYKFISNRQKLMKEEYEKNPDPQLLGTIFNFGNSLKVFKGILGGLNNEKLYNRKVEMENYLKSQAESDNNWTKIETEIKTLEQHAWAFNLLGPSPFRGKSILLAHSLQKYEDQLRNGAEDKELETTRKEIKGFFNGLGSERDKRNLTQTIEDLQSFIPDDNDQLEKLMKGKSASEYVDHLTAKSKFFKEKKREKLLTMKAKKFIKKKDPFLVFSREMIGAYNKASIAFQKSNPEISDGQKGIAGIAFDVYGEKLPPDATFTLRISDGRVNGYDYNGTRAPFQTTFFGLYDRYYSHVDKESWELPEKWLNPSLDLLKTPINFVSTNDIIGGNSGSPIINKDKEVVGLIFDGNIESLPGNFIFDEKANRSVSVHAGGILAALQYVYEAKRISMELLGKK